MALTNQGKRNAKHVDDIHNEIELARQTMSAFLERKLPNSGDQDWEQTRVRQALADFEAYHPNRNITLPNHTEITFFDFRTLTIVLRYNLDYLDFREKPVTPGEIASIVSIRNGYEHLDDRLNERDWQQDVNTIKVFRFKMMTEGELVAEYSLQELRKMEEEAYEYAVKISSVENEVGQIRDDLSNILGRVDEHAANDAAQFNELDRQRAYDTIHDESIRSNTSDIEWLTQRDRVQRHWIMGLIGISAASLLVATASLLRR